MRRFPMGIIMAVLGIAALLCVPQAAIEGPKSSVDLLLRVVIPSLLPFFICSRVLLASTATKHLGKALEPVVQSLFGLPGTTAAALAVSLISGYPSGARAVSDLYNEGYLRDEHVLPAALLCSTAGLVFVVGAIGEGLLGQSAAGWMIWGIQIAASFLCAFVWKIFLLRRPNTREIPDNTPPLAPVVTPPVTWTEAVASACTAMLTVSGYIVLFGAWTSVLEQLQVFARAGSLFAWGLRMLGYSPETWSDLLKGLVELTAGGNALSLNTDLRQILPLLCLVFGFGGTCILSQSFGFLANTLFPNANLLWAKRSMAL